MLRWDGRDENVSDMDSDIVLCSNTESDMNIISFLSDKIIIDIDIIKMYFLSIQITDIGYSESNTDG